MDRGGGVNRRGHDNLLPRDGGLFDLGSIDDADYLERLLAEPAWESDEVKMFGKIIRTARKVIYFGESDYRYSGVLKRAVPWSLVVADLRQRVEEITGETFNACLANLYHTGEEGMGWHSDDEPEIVPFSAIASLSFGAERRFVLRHKETKEKVELLLRSGSLVVMAGACQQFWQHTVPKTKKIHDPRVNLTFRKMTGFLSVAKKDEKELGNSA